MYTLYLVECVYISIYLNIDHVNASQHYYLQFRFFSVHLSISVILFFFYFLHRYLVCALYLHTPSDSSLCLFLSTLAHHWALYTFLVSDYIDVPTFNLSLPFSILLLLLLCSYSCSLFILLFSSFKFSNSLGIFFCSSFFLIGSCYVQRHSIHGMMEEENVIRPHQEIQALNYEEKKFLLAVERGDVASTRR